MKHVRAGEHRAHAVPGHRVARDIVAVDIVEYAPANITQVAAQWLWSFEH